MKEAGVQGTSHKQAQTESDQTEHPRSRENCHHLKVVERYSDHRRRGSAAALDVLGIFRVLAIQSRPCRTRKKQARTVDVCPQAQVIGSVH